MPTQTEDIPVTHVGEFDDSLRCKLPCEQRFEFLKAGVPGEGDLPLSAFGCEDQRDHRRHLDLTCAGLAQAWSRKPLEYVVTSGIDEYGEAWRCPADPVRLSCGDTVCRACVPLLGSVCPKCGESFILSNQLCPPSRMAQRLAKQIQCHCPNRGLGCEAVVGVLDVEHHLGTECEWREEECDQQVRRAEMARHKDTTCARKPMAPAQEDLAAHERDGVVADVGLLRQRLADTSADLTQCKADLAQTRHNLGQTREERTQSQYDLAQTKEELAQTKAELAQARDRASRFPIGLIPSIPPPVSHPPDTPAVFTYDHDMDERGLFYYIGTQGRTQPWQNPAEAGWVTITRSSDCLGKASDLTGRVACESHTNMQPTPLWWQVDLGAGRLFTPTRYTLRHSNHPADVVWRLQSWRLEGSVDGADGSWRTLDEHTNEPNAIPARPDAMATFALAPERAFPARHFRVLMTGPSPNGYQILMLSGLEMYGSLLPDPPRLQ
ncbi:putative E3 ubiquitin-protein ligase HECTD1 [Paratrimastix pyriformis]|uniref:E3 ubiquitin-protein ligase HECTD1 n=1 Tax=Paratrimastix pyriformis TaxID=342808 RepID=A0ABQ8UBK0_9EUKA|nr:putative E3 ubiquitin-protein ligase HECTD1 [Paratrimastix pyriformis]